MVNPKNQKIQFICTCFLCHNYTLHVGGIKNTPTISAAKGEYVQKSVLGMSLKDLMARLYSGVSRSAE